MECPFWVLDFRTFFVCQYRTMASEARASQLRSSRNFSSVAVAKNFVPLFGGCPNGLSNPALTRTGMSCEAKPRIHAASSATTRAGSIRTLKKSFRSEFTIL
jgi:hypothetical protein